MPIPTAFPQVTQVLGPPPTMDDKTCSNLPVFHDGRVWVSKWSLAPAEIEELQKTGSLWLTVHATGQPPVAIDVLPPLHPAPPQKPLELNGECCPRCKSDAGIRRLAFIWSDETLDWRGNVLKRDILPTKELSECVTCGYQVMAATEKDKRELMVCKAIHRVTGMRRELNESMEAYQARLINQYGSEWPSILTEIIKNLGL